MILRAWGKEKKPTEFTPLPLGSHSNPTQAMLGVPSMCSKCSLEFPFPRTCHTILQLSVYISVSSAETLSPIRYQRVVPIRETLHIEHLVIPSCMSNKQYLWSNVPVKKQKNTLKGLRISRHHSFLWYSGKTEEPIAVRKHKQSQEIVKYRSKESWWAIVPLFWLKENRQNYLGLEK